jgi:hypothetical protein
MNSIMYYIYNLFTPRYSWNTAKVGVKHQSINVYAKNNKILKMSRLQYEMAY